MLLKLCYFLADDFMSWIEVQVETTLSFVCIIAAIILAINAIIHMYKDPKLYLAWQIVTAVISGEFLSRQVNVQQKALPNKVNIHVIVTMMPH